MINRRAADPARAACVPRLCQPCAILAARPRRPWHTASGFTLIELLVTITIIGMLAGVTLGALQAARQTARKARTKALIVKLDHVIMQRYESYLTRRVPIRTSGTSPIVAARMRLDALRDLMRMELPERWSDVSDPVAFNWPGPTQSIRRPAVSYLYQQRYDVALATHAPDLVGDYGSAELLYMIVASSGADAMENMSPREIGDADGDGLPEFHDAWGNPVKFLRWAPYFSHGRPYNGSSEIQSGDPVTDHDPFDTRNVDSEAFRLIPLIYSAGPDGIYDINVEDGYIFEGDPYSHKNSGEPNESGMGGDYANVSVTAREPANGSLDHHDNIHNHYIE